MANVTAPILLDATGQEIKEALEDIKEALAPSNAVLFSEQTLTDAQKLRARQNIGAMAATPSASNFAEMQAIIRAGDGATAYPVGSIFYVPHTGIMSGLTINLPFEVVAHDHYPDPDGVLEHSMTVAMYYCNQGTQFDAPEAFYNTGADGLAAGTYHWKYNSTNLQFTLDEALGANLQLVRNSNTKMYVYNPANPTATFIKEVAMTTGTGGTDLGNSGATTGDLAYSINQHQRMDGGSNNYAQSNARQWLNSNQPVGQWWSASNKFDRPPSQLTMQNGFLYGLDTDFLSIVGYTNINCITNNIYEIGNFTPGVTYTLRDKFFLPSLSNLGFTGYSGEENVWDKYDGASSVDRIKYSLTATASPTRWFTRTPYASVTYCPCIIDTSGTNNGGYSAGLVYGLVAACTIR